MRTTLSNTLQRGLTLIELLVTLSIAVILLTVAVPSFVDMIASNTATSYANDLLGDLNYARSESITRGNRVTVCHSSDSATCSGTWSTGWIVFVNSVPSAPVTTVSDPLDILRIHRAVATGWTLTGNGNVPDYLAFRPDGLSVTVNGFGTGTFTFCKNTAVQTGNAVTVNKTGRVRVVDGACS